jgi:predicted dehydrogenase
MRTIGRTTIDSDQATISRRTFLELSGSATACLVAAGATLGYVGRAYPATSGKKIRMGVVGGGFGAGFYWHEHPNCVVTGVTDLYPGRRAGLKSRYKCDKVYDSLEIMLKEAKDIDAVAVFSGAPDHARHVKMCMERGWHTVSAVPACMTLDEAAMLKEVKEKTGLKYMMAESSYYNQECIYARNLFRADGFGELFYSETEYYHQLFNLPTVLTDKGQLCYDPGGKRSWRWGLPPMLYPTHSTGYLVGVTKERITKVSCLGWRGNSKEIRENPIVADNVYQNPFWCQASIMATDQGHMTRTNVFWICVAGGERAQWFGDQATLYMANWGVHGPVEHSRAKGAHPVKVPEYWKTDMLPDKMRHASGHGGSAVFISAEFINALLEDREPAIDLYESLAMTVPGIVAHQSAFKDGEQLSVPQFDRAKKA